MKKLWMAVISVFLLSGCQEDLQDNTPALEGIKDGVTLWRAISPVADIDAGALIVQGNNNSEVLTLVATNDNVGTYFLGGNFQAEARFVDAQGVTYSTLNPPDPSVSIYSADGEIVIEDFENSTNTVTGTFKFNAFTADGLRSVNFIEGVFYQIPLTGGIVVIGGGTSCQNAQIAVTAAAADFAATDMTMPNYTSLCDAYKNALTVQIFSCGDSSGALQALIDSLGDCS